MIGELVKYLFKLLLIACSFDSCRDLVAEIFYDCWLDFDQARHSFKIVWKRVNLVKKCNVVSVYYQNWNLDPKTWTRGTYAWENDPILRTEMEVKNGGYLPNCEAVR